MGYWLRFAVIDKQQLCSEEIVQPQQVLELYSCSRGFVASVHPLYEPELTPVLGTAVPRRFRLHDDEDPNGLLYDQYGPLHFYTKEELLEAYTRSLPFYTPPPQDEEMFDVVRALPDNMVLVKILLY